MTKMLQPNFSHPLFTKYNSLVLELEPSSNVNAKLSALRSIKNAVIGNSVKKQLFMHLGVIPKCVEILADPRVDINVKTQSAIVLGSFAYGDDQNIESLVVAGAIIPLLECLLAPDIKLVEASARALKIMLQNPIVPREDVFKERYLEKLVQFLSLNDIPSSNLTELAASIVARCCEEKEHQVAFEKKGAVESIISILCISNQPKTHEAALDALSAFVRDNKDLASRLSSLQLKVMGKEGPQSIFYLMQRHLHDKRPNMRLIAVTCYTNFFRTGVIAERKMEIVQHVMPVIFKLFQEQSVTIKEKAALVMAYLVSDNDELQKSASEMDAIPKLALLFTSAHAMLTEQKHDRKGNVAARLCENTLIALAGVCSLQEECRKAVIETKILPQVVKALEHPDVGVRTAACQTMRSLSRSVKNLRTSLLDAGLAMPLFHLLSDKSPKVQVVASATLCNIVLDFSPMKKIVLENGGIDKLVELSSSMDFQLRFNSIWALKNLLYQADFDTKSGVMQKLGFNTLVSLLDDPETQVQEQSINLLRNIACRDEKDISLVFDGIGPQKLMEILNRKLEGAEEIILQALYVLVNLSTGNEVQKNSIMNNRDILNKVIGLITHQKPSIRVATVWVVINLTWADEPVADERVKKLKELGFEDKLTLLIDDEDLDVRERVRTALQHLNARAST